jgi:hypothetical protein
VTNRYVAVLVPRAAPAAPPGIDPDEFRLALVEDTYEVVAGLELVTPALLLKQDDPEVQQDDAEAPRDGPGVQQTDPEAEAITWPGTPILRAANLVDAYDRLRELGAEEAAIVAADAPDLPPLLIGKLFRALGHAPAAVCPHTDGGGLVALAVRLPAPPWLFHVATGTGLGVLDMPDAFARLRAAAPRPGAVQAGPGWHRLRDPADLAFLDPGLEGWENTRALLAGHPLR